MIRLLLVDDQPAARRGLRVRFHLEPDLQVVGEASTGSEALTLVKELKPDVVLMDIEMPGMDGITATRRRRFASPERSLLRCAFFIACRHVARRGRGQRQLGMQLFDAVDFRSSSMSHSTYSVGTGDQGGGAEPRRTSSSYSLRRSVKSACGR